MTQTRNNRSDASAAADAAWEDAADAYVADYVDSASASASAVNAATYDAAWAEADGQILGIEIGATS